LETPIDDLQTWCCNWLQLVFSERTLGQENMGFHLLQRDLGIGHASAVVLIDTGVPTLKPLFFSDG
jgi:hypothetical protein